MRTFRGWADAALAAAVLAAACLRLADLGAMPVHADESTNAYLLDTALRTGATPFNPRHHHGPLLLDLGRIAAACAGQHRFAEFQIEPLRLLSALAGIATVAALFLFRRWFGAPGAACAAWLIALSPLLAFYSRVFIHETTLGLLSLLGFLAGARFLETRAVRWALALGLSLGLMFAAKATFLLTAVSWALAAAIAAAEARGPRSPAAFPRLFKDCLPGFAAAAMAFAAAAALLYSDFGRQPAAILDAVRSYWTYETDPGHNKHAGYYLAMLLPPRKAAATWWTESAIAALAAIGWFLARPRPNSGQAGNPMVRAAAWSGALQIAMYSALAYKTPWLMVVPWLHLALAAGSGAAEMAGRLRPAWARAMFAAAAAAALAHLGFQTGRACFRFPADSRNPYTYSPTSPDAADLERLLSALADAGPGWDSGPVAIVGRDVWPLPWYLRRFPQMGQWDEVPAEAPRFPLVVAMPERADAAAAALAGTHFAFPKGLRHETPVMVFVRNDLWRLAARVFQRQP